MKCKRHFGDRYDGRLIRNIDPFFKIIPYIMKTRGDSQNLFDDEIDISGTESYLKKKRDEGIKNIRFLHVMIAAMVRTISQKPGLNRFIAGQKIYARNEILISLALKKQLTEESPETTIKLKFEPTDTIYEIVSKVNQAIEENKIMDTENGTDKAAKIFMMCPGFIVKFLVWFFKSLDYFGIMPRALNNISPFHTSVFITDLGSIGIKSIYHHLYEFGTTSIFVAFGIKQREKTIDKTDNITERKYISMKVVTDERIVDGFYYARSFKLFKNLIENPGRLDFPPEKIINDID